MQSETERKTTAWIKTNLGLYATNISMLGRQAVVIGSGGGIIKVTGLCNSTISINEDPEEIEEFKMMFPNPVSDYLNFPSVDFSSDTEWKIYNVLGQLMLSGSNSNPINISHFSKGVYFIKLEIANKFYLQKFVKK
jgi:serine protease AprX